MNKHFFCLFLTITLILGSSIYVNASVERDAQFWENYVIANSTAFQIKNAFTQNNDGRVEYSDFFGGLYINEEGNLIVLIVDEHVVCEVEVARLSLLDIRFVDFSYSTLNDVFSVVSYYLHANWTDANNTIDWSSVKGLGKANVVSVVILMI